MRHVLMIVPFVLSALLPAEGAETSYYLFIPQLVGLGGDQWTTNADTPITRWFRTGPFNAVAECDRARLGIQREARAGVEGTEFAGTTIAAALAKATDLARCVATDDPQLR